MTGHIDRFWDEEEEPQAGTPQVEVDDLEAVEEDEQLGDAGDRPQ